MTTGFRKALLALSAIGLGAAGYFIWTTQQAGSLPAGIVGGNGRIEAVEIDISTKTAGRIRDILVNDGDFVEAGQIVAVMDTRQLDARRRQAEAELQRAVIGIDTAGSVVKQREAERAASEALLAQREAELDAASRRFARSEKMAESNTATQQALDNDRASAEGAKAAVSAARAQMAATEAAINAAKAQVVDANAVVEAAKAAIDSIDADLSDSTLRAPRAGRVQYRVAQPGEVLSAGGNVLNMVDLSDVQMTIFLPTAEAGRVAIGTEVRIVLDAVPQYVIPATASFVADVAQFTPKTVETEEERQKLMFRVKAKIAPDLLRKYIRQVKTGLPGMAYIRLDEKAVWPADLENKLPQ